MIWYLSFSVWPTSLSTITARSILCCCKWHYGIISFVSMDEQYSIIYMYVYIFLWRWEVKFSGINISTTGRHMHRTQTQLTEWLPLIRSKKPVYNEYLLCAHTGEGAYTNFMQWSSHTCAHTHTVLFLHAVDEKGNAQAD